jgi:cardiolipin synthase
MIHCKVLVVDGASTSVGSSNFDDRSFRLNDEANLNVFSEEFAREQVALIDADFESAVRLSRRRWSQRPFARRVYENVAILLRSQL